MVGVVAWRANIEQIYKLSKANKHCGGGARVACRSVPLMRDAVAHVVALRANIEQTYKLSHTAVDVLELLVDQFLDAACARL